MPPTKTEPTVRFVAPAGTQSVGSENHTHKVVEGFIDCEECARALGWPAEGAVPEEPARQINQAMAMNQ